jgi:hypothetical protein
LVCEGLDEGTVRETGAPVPGESRFSIKGTSQLSIDRTGGISVVAEIDC